MFDFEIKLDKKNSCAKLFALFNLSNAKDLSRFQAITNLFELDEVQLKCIIRVKQSSAFLKLNSVDTEIKVIVKETKKLLLSKELCCDIEIEFFGKSLNTLIELASKENEALYIIPADDNSQDIELALNDNDHNHITFSLKKYNVEEIKSQIKQIYKQKN